MSFLSPFKERNASSAPNIYAQIEQRKRKLYLAALLIGIPPIFFVWRLHGSNDDFIRNGYPFLLGITLISAFALLFQRVPLRWVEYFIQTGVSLFQLAKYIHFLRLPDSEFVRAELNAVVWVMMILFIIAYIIADHHLALLMTLGYAGVSLALSIWFLLPGQSDLFLETSRMLARLAAVSFLTFILAKAKDDLITAQRHANYMETAANTDALTGLPNRRMIDNLLNDYLKHNLKFTLLLVDVDYFKRINDTHGHDTGDLVLLRLAQALRNHLRKDDVVARWGGEEFVVVLFEYDDQSTSAAVERLRQMVETLQPINIPITVSIGCAARQRGDTPASIFKRADEALYRAKSAGRNCARWQD